MIKFFDFLKMSGLGIVLLAIFFAPQLTLAVATPGECPSGYPDLSCAIYKKLFVCGEPNGTTAPKDCQIGDLLDLAKGIMDVLLFMIVTPVAVLLLLYSGILFVTSPNKPANVAQAKKVLSTALKGYAIALVGYVVVKAIVLGMIDPSSGNETAAFIKSIFSN